MAKTTTVDTNSTKETSQPESKMNAVNQVFTTYELLESIILSLRPQDIPVMAKVNKACHDVIIGTTCVKHTMTTTLFLCKVATPKHYYNTNAMSVKMSWGHIIIRSLPGKEVVMLKHMSKKSNEFDRPQAGFVFLSGDEAIPGLSGKDAALLSWGWINALKDRRKWDERGGLVNRLEKGCSQMITQAYGK